MTNDDGHRDDVGDGRAGDDVDDAGGDDGDDGDDFCEDDVAAR